MIAHEGVHHAVAHGLTGAHVRMSTAVGHRWDRGQSERRAVAVPPCLRTIPGRVGVAAGGGRHGGGSVAKSTHAKPINVVGGRPTARGTRDLRSTSTTRPITTIVIPDHNNCDPAGTSSWSLEYDREAVRGDFESQSWPHASALPPEGGGLRRDTVGA